VPELTQGESILWEDRGIVLLVGIAIALLVVAAAVGLGVFHR
jgi:hypothetical protein